MGMGILQMLVQLILFLHLSTEKRPHWNTILFLFMLLICLIVVAGSLWIMSNLDYRMMSPSQHSHTALFAPFVAARPWLWRRGVS
jgi:cytochrome o ubiquinol oxidase operon protein cyoD